MKMKKILCLAVAVLLVFSTCSAVLATEEPTFEQIAPAEATALEDCIRTGIQSAESYIREQLAAAHTAGGVSYGFEWYILSMLRGGKTVDSAILDEYFTSVVETAKGWDANVKPTDAEKVALVLTVMGKDITDVDGVNLMDIICNSERLTEGANELAYALLAMYASGTEIPEGARWNESSIITELLRFQANDGGFGLSDNTASDVDVTAMCVQALSPYRNQEAVNTALLEAVEFLKNNISDAWNYQDNPNSTAQVLLALATLGIDVTDSAGGFGESVQENILTALEEYKSADGNGYIYNSSVSGVATYQIMQAYDAYRKAQKEGLHYWDFAAEGQVYDDGPANGGNTEPEETEAEPVDIYVTIADEGSIARDKDGGYVAQARVTVTDIDRDGTLTVDEALYATHEAYYEGGAQAGYSTFAGDYGLSLDILWGKGTENVAAAAGYYLNNASCWSLQDAVEEGDFLTAFNYYDSSFYSDAYAYFSESTAETKKGTSVTLSLHMLGYDAEWNTVVLPCEGAKIVFLGSNNSGKKVLTTDKDGEVRISFKGTSGVGTYYAMAYKEDGSIIPAICKIEVTANSEGGGAPRNISVYIKVADPKGATYLKKTAYVVEAGTTVYDLLAGTGLDVEATQTVYGTYVTAIEGLAEFDEGPRSGWMYRVNGKFSSQSASLYTLSGGAYVEWLYTRELGEDIGEKNSNAPSFINNSLKEDKTEEPENAPAEQKTVFTEDTYIDVTPEDWHYESVKYVYENNLMQGMGNGFQPESKMTRAMLITVLWRLEKEPSSNYRIPFADIKEGEWYTEAVCWAASEQIISGIGETLFGTNNEITREQLATILCRYAQKKNIEIKENKETRKEYTDKGEIAEYAVSAMEWAVDSGIMKGKTENTISPADSATRAEVATMLMRFCKEYVE